MDKPQWLLIFLIFPFLSTSCIKEDYVAESQTLFNEIKVLQCREMALKSRVDSIWGHLSQSLEEKLPEDMPYQERINMVTLRNADLIRMFDSYDSLSPSTHRMVDSIEMMDKEVVSEFSGMKSEMAALEERRMKLFERVESESPEELSDLRAQFEVILSSECK